MARFKVICDCGWDIITDEVYTLTALVVIHIETCPLPSTDAHV